MILKLTREINKKVRSTVRLWKFVQMVCDISIVEQYTKGCPCLSLLTIVLSLSFDF